MSEYRFLTTDKPIPKKTSVVLEKLVSIKENLENLKLEIKGDKISKFSNEEIVEFRKRFKEAYSEYDKANKVESGFTKVEQESIAGRPIDLQCIFINIEIQTLISRITNKIQREEAVRLNKYYKDIDELQNTYLKTYNEIKKETITLKESVITISSLIFMAFTFIQLNFVAFQSSKDYLVLDRIVLFAGINLFLIIGIYSILSMIKSLLSSDLNETKEKILFNKIKVIIIIFVFIFAVSLTLKARVEDKNEKDDKILLKNLQNKIENIDKDKALIEETQKKISNLEEDIKKINIKILNLEDRTLFLEKENIENKRLELKKEVLELNKEIKELKMIK